MVIVFLVTPETVIAEAMEVDQKQNRCNHPGQWIGKDHRVNAPVVWHVKQQPQHTQAATPSMVMIIGFQESPTPFKELE